MANAVVYEVCSGSQPASTSPSLIVGIGAADSSLTGGTGVYRAPQVGDLLVVFVGSDNTSGTPNAAGVSDSKGNTWTAVQTQVGAVNQQFRVFATVVAAGKALTVSDTITATFASNAGTHHLIAKAIVGPASVTSSNGVTTQGSGGGTWSSGASGALSGTKVVVGFLQSAAAGGKPSAITFDAASATFTQAPSGHWSAFMVDTAPPAGGEAAGGTTASGTWAAGVVAWTAPTPVTGTGAVASRKASLAGSGTYTAPVTGTGAVVVPGAPSVILAGAGTYTAPVTGTGAVASRKPSLAGSGTYTGPYSGTGAFAAKKPALAATGTFTPAPTTGTGAVKAKKPALAASGTYTPAPTTGTGSVTAKKIALAGAGAYAAPATGTASVKAKKIALAGLGSYAGGITGTAALAAKKIALAGLGTYTPAPVTGTGSFHAKKPALAGTGAANLGPVTGFGSFTAKKIALTGYGTVGGAAPPVVTPLAVIAPSALVPVVWDDLALNEGERDDGLCTVVTLVEGWYGSPPLAGNDLLRVLTDGAVYGYKTLGPRVVAITGAATGPRDLLNQFARNLAGKRPAGSRRHCSSARTTGPTSPACSPRPSGPIPTRSRSPGKGAHSLPIRSP